MNLRFTREELESALHGSHWISRLRGGASAPNSTVFQHLDRLRFAGALVGDRMHFTGLRVRRNLVAVELHADGSTVRLEEFKGRERRVKVRSQRALGE